MAHTAELEPQVLPQEALPQNGAEFLRGRIDQAINNCEIAPSPEVAEALTGYYTDHYALADTIKGAIDGTISDEDIDKILSVEEGSIPTSEFGATLEMYDFEAFPTMPSAESATRLMATAIKVERSADSEEAMAKAHDITLRAATEALGKVLFQEHSLGVTTIGKDELKIVGGLWQTLTANLEGTTGHVTEKGTLKWPINNGRHTKDFKLEYIEKSIKMLQDSFWNDVRHAGQLEFHNSGDLGDVTTDGYIRPRTEQHRRSGKMNAQTAVRDRMHSVVPHFSEQFDPRGYKHGTQNSEYEKTTGTVAVAMADVVKVAPYARDARYAVVRPRDEAVLERVPLRSKESTTDINYGHDDNVGANGTDRVFFAAPTEKGETKPDEYGIELDRHTTLIFVGEDEIQKSASHGIGESFPDQLLIKTEAEALDEIAGLQDEYLKNPRYSGQLVIPLRRGVFDFAPENMDVHAARGRRAPEYNWNPAARRPIEAT